MSKLLSWWVDKYLKVNLDLTGREYLSLISLAVCHVCKYLEGIFIKIKTKLPQYGEVNLP